MSINNFSYTGLGLTKEFEGTKLRAYQDGAGVWTIGDGHTEGVHQGDTCTQAQADLWLSEECQGAANTVNRLVTVKLTQEEFNALVDFVYNLGSGTFARSSLLKDLNAGLFNKVAGDIEEYDLVGGKECAGILRRRVAEVAEFDEKP